MAHRIFRPVFLLTVCSATLLLTRTGWTQQPPTTQPQAPPDSPLNQIRNKQPPLTPADRQAIEDRVDELLNKVGQPAQREVLVLDVTIGSQEFRDMAAQ